MEGAGVNVHRSLPSTPVTPIALAGMLVMAGAVGIGRFAYTPLLPPMRDALVWTVSQAGDVASANFLGYMLGALLASALAQRPTRHLWLLAAMVLSAMTTTAGVVVVAFPAWVGMRFCSGVASAFCLVLSTATVIEFLIKHARPQLGALHFSGVGIGIVVSVLVIELARLAGASMFGRWGALGIISSVFFAGAWMIFRTLPKLLGTGRREISQASQGYAPTTLLLRKLIITYGLFGFGYIVTATFIVAMARRLEHATFVEPLTWIVFGLLAAPSVLAWQRLAQHLGMFPTLRLAYGVEAVGVLLAGFGSGYIALLLGGALLGGTFMGITALGLSAARQAPGHNPDKVIGWMTASFGLGQCLGPAIAGRLAQMTQGFTVPSLVAASLLMVGILLLRGRHDEGRKGRL